ncbi:MAG: TonB-dependent receptor [Deltaproteobacteria bacterium]|nr:TonB-dependent receptor [Deltaproteobacteria bacterium]
MRGSVLVGIAAVALVCGVGTARAQAAPAASAETDAAEDGGTVSGATQSGSDEPLATIVVTATRTETRLDETTTTVTVIDRAEIEQRHAETVVELLRDVPDVDVVQNGSRGTNTELFLRGADADQTLVLIDGVEVNSVTLGAFDFSSLTTDNVERIEVLRGAGGTLYGSQAIGGVINVITRAGGGAPHGSVLGEGGNGSTGHGAVSSAGQMGRLRYSVAGAYLDTQGFHAHNDDYRNGTASLRLDYDVAEHATARLFFRYANADVGLINSNNFLAAPDPNARQSDELYLIKGEWEQELIPDLELRVAGSFAHSDEHFNDPPDAAETSDTRSTITGGIVTSEIQLNHYWKQLMITTAGIEFEERSANIRSLTVDPAFTFNDHFDESRRNVAGYFQEQLRLLDGALLGVGGVRVDGNQEFGTAVSPSGSVSYALPIPGVRLKAGYAEGFRAPTFNELFFPNFGNPNLGAETSREYSVGVVDTAWQRRATSELALFDRVTHDLIEGQPQPDGSFQAENVGTVHVRGVEIAPRVLVWRDPDVTIGASYARLFRVDTPPLLRRPKHRGGVTVNVAGRDLLRPRTHYDVNLNLRVVGDRQDVNPAAGFAFDENPAYTKVDLAASYTLEGMFPRGGDLTLFAKVENLLDARYDEALGFRAPPINFLAGLRAAF